MTAKEQRALSAAIAAGIREGLAPLVAELHELVATIDVAQEIDGAPVETDPLGIKAGCAHPDKLRITFGSMGTAGDEWECATARGGCGFRSKG